MLDIHLSANRISPASVDGFTSIGFSEDFFFACKNCAPTQFHATLKVEEQRADEVWHRSVNILDIDEIFNGALEQERHIWSCADQRLSASLIRPMALPKQKCPPQEYKVCDVHIRASAHAHSSLARDWLDSIDLASFRRTIGEEEWVVYTATFDSLDAGSSFSRFVYENAPRNSDDRLRVKFEGVDRVFRKPCNANVLPLTRTDELQTWLCSMGGTWHKEASSSARPLRRDTLVLPQR